MIAYLIHFLHEPNIKLEIMLIHFTLYNIHFQKLLIEEYLPNNLLIVIVDSDISGLFIFFS